jgi:NADH-quinone oxidoreductase subunit G
MAKLVSLSIDGKPVTVPEGTLIVNAAKQAGVDIPVFCYHPKMEPVGMCRVCLVEVGRPLIDRLSGQMVREPDGSPKIQFSPKLETACTTPVSEGMVVLGASQNAQAGREDILEFLLTSHPLDCPICDKGGECPLQNLTMNYGPGVSRYLYDEKKHLAKHIPLGELIYLDRERCIQCARCVRFQDEIVDDPVIGFYQRGRSLEIVTFSEPGFDSHFSGNTTDICPVGALTTADFRFGARPWEMNAAASICSQCPVGCNLTYNVRREAKSGGNWAIKRVMPRQNEAVNEIWICDKGRFAYQFLESAERLQGPLARQNGELAPVSWEAALQEVALRFRDAGPGLLTLAGGRLSNEDLYNIRQLTLGLGGRSMLYTTMAGGDLVAKVGVGAGTNFAALGPETAVLVVASDLREEAPVWWLRVKGAAGRGARLIVANPRPTRLDKYATQIVRYPYGSEAAAVLAMVNALSAKRPGLPETVQDLLRSKELQEAARIFAEAENAIVIFGSEGLGLEGSQALAQACANLLISTAHVGRPNNGLIGVWQKANEQGAWDMGWQVATDLEQAMRSAKALYVVAADPAGDNPDIAQAAEFMVVQDLFLTSTAKLADVVLPAMPYSEREGTYTSGERRVQRFYPLLPPRPGCKADFAIGAQIGQMLGLDLEGRHASRVMSRIAGEVPAYRGLSYDRLAEVVEQWPIVGRQDLYYGGTTYENSQGTGLQLASAAERGENVPLGWPQLPVLDLPAGALLAVPTTLLYDRGQTVLPSTLLHPRIPQPYVSLNPTTAGSLGILNGSSVQVRLNGSSTLVTARLDETLPEGIVLTPRSLGIPIVTPTQIEIRMVERVVA